MAGRLGGAAGQDGLRPNTAYYIKGNTMGLVLLILLILLLLGAIPHWGYSKSWGYGPSGLLGVVLIVVIILILTDNLNVNFS